MARLDRRRTANADGDLFVDDSCIDCDTCRWMAPMVFARVDGQSAVVRQPDDASRAAAMQALVACPTASIGLARPAPADLRVAAESFPSPVAANVFHCGYHSVSSFGATSYLIVRNEADGSPGNVLVDSPRFAAPLVRRLEAMGGVRWMVLTHRDDVADHAKFAEHFGSRRVLHRDDVTRGTSDVEVQPEGTEPTRLAPDLLFIPTPGHTRGHAVLLHREFLFTGDHLAGDETGLGLEAWPDVCWYDWSQQTRSMRRLAEYEFQWVLPGHGRRVHAPAASMRQDLLRLVVWMESAGTAR